MFQLDDCIAFLAGKTAKRMADLHEKQLKKVGITRAQWMAMYYISTSETITQKELSVMLSSREATIARLLDRMEAAGIITRIPKDKRTNIITLTPEGQRLYKKGMDITEEYRKKIMGDLSEKNIADFKAVLKQLDENANQIH